MECLNNLVDVWNGVDEKDPLKFYLNDLPGFELNNAELIANSEHTDGMELLASNKREAIRHLIEDFSNHLNERARFSTVLTNQIAGKYDENLREKPAQAGKYKGIQISLSSYPYLSLYIDRISVFTKSAITTNILVYDLQQGIQIDSFPITTLAGQITPIEVGKEYKNKGQYLNLAFVIDSSLSIVYNTITSKPCDRCFYRLESMSRFTDGRGISIDQSDQKIESNVRGESHTNGISVTYSVQCDPTYFLCSMANRFRMALRYRWGMEYFNAVLKSSRANSQTTVLKEDAEQGFADCQLGYQTSMETVLKNITIPNNYCYSCNPIVSQKSKFG